MVLAKMLVFPHMHSVDIHEGRSFPLEQIVRHASLPQATAILQYYGARGLDDEDGLGANLKPSPKATPATERPVEASVN
jgi:hypothetical protein